eukprot:TRINITY_DN2596_c0_g1_i6.p1 TRINITY_DN2596_c0_g1~~TRINITY_DN2596_c0_g1_i6.p1  ORF type:complete len:188 (+),score=72.64 TRINITY_DN2596_c0_g1_i6:78-566(+)
MTLSTFPEEFDPVNESSSSCQLEVDGRDVWLEIMYKFDKDDLNAVIKESEGFFFVYSITDAKSTEGLKALKQKILKLKDVDTVPMVLFGNKSDLEQERAVSVEDGEKLAQDLDCVMFEGSAKEDVCVQDAFVFLCRGMKAAKRRNAKREMKGGKNSPKCVVQ